MYVSGLDRPWLETPFPIQGFLIRSYRDIELLRQLCEYVVIDTALGKAPATRAPVHHPTPRITVTTQAQRQKLVPHGISVRTYPVTRSLEDELPIARIAYKQLSRDIETLLAQLRSTPDLDLKRWRRSVGPMVSSVIRNPDACALLTRLKSQGSYAFKHALSVSVWCTLLGRQLGLPRPLLEDLALGGILLDVGHLDLPEGLINHDRRLTDAEFRQMQNHVEHGLERLEAMGNRSQVIRDMVAAHHERHAGHGYPNRLKGKLIPFYGRIAAIADCYDAMTSERPYAAPISPSEAVSKLYEWRNVEFQAELIEEFIQAIGLYPAGTLVELTDGRVGIVIKAHVTRRLRPRILLLRDADKQPVSPEELDLLTLEQTLGEEAPGIRRALQPGAYGIDMEALEL